MGGANIAANTLIKTSMSRLKRGKTYLFDAMNLLYSMCYISAISDLLQQKPAVPTRQIVSACLSFVFFGGFGSFFASLIVFIYVGQAFTYLDRWCERHSLNEVHIIFVIDGRVDPFKVSRNRLHERRKRELQTLKRRIGTAAETEGDVTKYTKLRRRCTRFVLLPCCLFSCLSVFLPACLCSCLSGCMPVLLPARLSSYLHACCLSSYLSMFLLACLSVCMFD